MTSLSERNALVQIYTCVGNSQVALVANALVADLQIDTGGVWVAIVCRVACAFVKHVAYFTLFADAVVAPWQINAVSVAGTEMSASNAFVIVDTLDTKELLSRETRLAPMVVTNTFKEK